MDGIDEISMLIHEEMPVYANKGGLDVHTGKYVDVPRFFFQRKNKGVGIDFLDVEGHPIQGSDFMRCLGLFQVAAQVDPV
ncbi:hypothetical protein JQC72_12450 [Polycladomyces sp. WAk]|uniref:Uncharacterized protein n=1 Tax=Polycladomyces zharkentensis TaxID=2807616 RepID=A0ABS2WL99_9BACL|nr:hypothetical protein [Polycladomyces sp. WAk]MBN2910308.1 hypothetical protein [Polycladomyces sp. WAk]